MIDFFFHPVEKILQTKDSTTKALHRLNIFNIRDLLFHKPSHYIIKNISPNLSNLFNNENIIFEAKIDEIIISNRKTGPHKIFVSNETGGVELVFFHNIPQFIHNNLRIGNILTIEGKVKKIGGYPQISHPDLIFNKDNINKFEPIYPLTYGLVNKQIHSLILKSLSLIPELTLNLDDNITISLTKALSNIHKPQKIDNNQDIRDLALLELLCNQTMLAFTRQRNRVKRDYQIIDSENIKRIILQKLGFELTSCQINVLNEIKNDFASEFRMIRMLQGDVGSGKTIIALLSMLDICSSSKQCAFMAPTDLLATQHFNLFSKLLDGLDIHVALLTGATKIKDRRIIQEGLKSGKIHILIGTHAIFQEKVEYNDLKYIVIDEQHRFGVEQRISLIDKSNNADLLVMTATPIPRSLTLTLFGDMPVSQITTKPKGRSPTLTISLAKSRIQELFESMRHKISNKEKIFWICPLIEENEEEEIKKYSNVNSRAEILEKIFPNQVLLIHGKLKQKEKDQKMIDFKEGEKSILVSTTVIEVGIDIPQATLIIIEDSEKFGLAQIHQLRGRVGRGDKQSHCVLLFGDKISTNAHKRISILKQSSDGFFIAEQDLLLRGGGDILGIKQSGEQSFYFADLYRDRDLLIKANKIANSGLLENNDNLEKLINIFNKDKERYIESG